MLSTLTLKRALTFSSIPALFALTACADPQGAYDEFEARVAEATTSSSGTGMGGAGGSGCELPAAGEIDGDFFVVLSASLTPKKPITMFAKITTSEAGGALNMAMNLQPLLASDRRTPVGASIDVPSFPVAADGSYTVAVPPADIDGAANPISGNTLINVQATLMGTVCKPAEFLCGTVSGSVETPKVTLDGSNFTMQPITDPSAYPETYINCNKDLAVSL